MPEELNDNPDDTGDGADEPQYVTSEQLNRAISGHMKRLEGRLGASLKTSLAELMADRTPEPEPDTPEPDPDTSVAKPDPQMVALKRQLSALGNKLKASEDAQKASESKRQQATLRSAVNTALGELGMSGQHLKGATAALYHEGRVAVGEDGAALFRDQDGTELPLADGLRDWAASDEAKLYQAPRSPRGSGDRGHSQAVPTDKPGSLDEALGVISKGLEEMIR